MNNHFLYFSSLKKENIKVGKIGSVTRKISKSTLRKRPKMTCSCPFLITSLVKMKQVIKPFYLLYGVVCQWWIIRKPTGNLRKPAAAVSGRFLDFFINKKIDKKIYINKKSENLPKTCWKPPQPVFGGFLRFPEVFGGFWRFPEVSGDFRRFLDNASLKNHTTTILEFQAEHSKFDHF